MKEELGSLSLGLGSLWRVPVRFKFKRNFLKALIQGALLSGLMDYAGVEGSFSEAELKALGTDWPGGFLPHSARLGTTHLEHPDQRGAQKAWDCTDRNGIDIAATRVRNKEGRASKKAVQRCHDVSDRAR